jgi:hypothetical protein
MLELLEELLKLCLLIPNEKDAARATEIIERLEDELT